MGDTVLITGAAGFIGARFVSAALRQNWHVISLDRLSYAASLDRLDPVMKHDNHVFIEGDIQNSALVRDILTTHRPSKVIHFAAETHVDRSIDDGRPFLEHNTIGTYELLSGVLEYWRSVSRQQMDTDFRFIHISTDEVYGPCARKAFSEDSPIRPSSPYAASKAAAEAYVSAFQTTYGLPVNIIRPSNTYGPGQYPEKLIPLMIAKALSGEPLPLYGDGLDRREWLFVDDLVAAILAIATAAKPGQTFNVAGFEERSNHDVVLAVLRYLMQENVIDRQEPESLIHYVPDRPGHDRRYAIDAGFIDKALGWRAATSFAEGLAMTVQWYLDHGPWWQDILARGHAGQRLGLGGSGASVQ